MFAKRVLLILLLICVVVDLGYAKEKKAKKKKSKNKKKNKKVNGGFSEYTDWSHCSVPCGGGEQTQTRTCTDPAPANGGKECDGDVAQSRPCNTEPCPGSTRVAGTTVTLTEKGWGVQYPWPAQQMIRISVNCITSQPYVTLYIPLVGGDGARINWFPDENKMQIYCPGAVPLAATDVTFTPDCSTGGNVTYTVQWTTDSILVVHEGVLVAVKQRDGRCTAQPDKWQLYVDESVRLTATDEVDGGFSEWSDWSTCSVDCGTGTKSRTRTCTILTYYEHVGSDCEGESEESQPCNTDPCPGSDYSNGKGYNVVTTDGEQAFWDKKGKIYKWDDKWDNPMTSTYFRSIYKDVHDSFKRGEMTNWANVEDNDAYLNSIVKFVDIGCPMAWTTELASQSTIFVAYVDTKEGKEIPPILNDWGCTLDQCLDVSHSWFGYEPTLTTSEFLDADKPRPLAALQDSFLSQFQESVAALGFEKARSTACVRGTLEATRFSLAMHTLEAETDVEKVSNPGSLGQLEGKKYVGVSGDLATAHIMHKLLEFLCPARVVVVG